MKNKYIILLVLAAFFAACTDKFEDFNTDKKNPAIVPGEALFSNAQKLMVDYISSTNVNTNVWKLFAQYWTETTYIEESNYDIINRTIPDGTFNQFYRGFLLDFKEAKRLITESVPASQIGEVEKANKLAIIELLECFSYQMLVDIFGDVPYSEALDINNIHPAYEDAASIYTDLINRVNNALGELDASQGSFGSADLIYGGDISSWIKFANSLKVKLGIHIADVNPSLAQSTIESAVAAGVIEPGDDALFPYQTASPNYNPLYDDLVASGRSDFVAANTLVDELNRLQDPRIFIYLKNANTFKYRSINNTKQDSTVTSGNGKFFIYNNIAGLDSIVYIVPPYTILASDSAKNPRHFTGGEYGYNSPASAYANVSELFEIPTFPGIIMTFDEIAFYLAEAAARGYSVGGTEEEWYNIAIAASFAFWGLSETDAESYLEMPDVAYATAPGDWKRKIGTQAWLAFYTRGLEGYTSWRRLDWPIFNLAESISEYAEIPKRFTYPINEQTLNTDNYQEAASNVGGDLLTTPLFWDVAQPAPPVK